MKILALPASVPSGELPSQAQRGSLSPQKDRPVSRWPSFLLPDASGALLSVHRFSWFLQAIQWSGPASISGSLYFGRVLVSLTARQPVVNSQPRYHPAFNHASDPLNRLQPNNSFEPRPLHWLGGSIHSQRPGSIRVLGCRALAIALSSFLHASALVLAADGRLQTSFSSIAASSSSGAAAIRRALANCSPMLCPCAVLV